MRVPAGKGAFVLNQMKLDQPIPETASLVERLRNLLLTNLGCDLKGDADAVQARLQRLAQYQFTPIDLGAYVNRGLKDDKAAGIVGWANQEENDMADLPTGKQTFAGVPFVISTPKSAITLYSVNANRMLPKEVKGMKVGVKADLLYFLHSSAWSYDGNDVCVYRVHYEDASTEEIPVRCGQQVFDWWLDPAQVNEAMAKFGVFAAWQGQNRMTRSQGRWGVWLPCYEWANPHPEKVIRNIDFCAVPKHDYGPVATLVGITAASLQADEGVVTDVINTRGIKVKIARRKRKCITSAWPASTRSTRIVRRPSKHTRPWWSARRSSSSTTPSGRTMPVRRSPTCISATFATWATSSTDASWTTAWAPWATSRATTASGCT